MIAVIADDFTGAAEIGGIGLRHGLKVVIETEPLNGHDADLLVIATDTRSLSPEEASSQIDYITKALLKLNPELIYKKIDSVLRGNITDELMAQMNASGKKRTVIIAANPVFNRIIKDGEYYINNIPLHRTSFSNDPQLKISSSNVIQIINKDQKFPVYNLKCMDNLPENGFIMGDVTSIKDLENWSDCFDNQTLLAGASGFFNAILNKRNNKILPKEEIGKQFADNSLFVLGSTYPKEVYFYKRMIEAGYYLSNIPKEFLEKTDDHEDLIQLWARDIIDGLEKYKRVVVYINHPVKIKNEIAVHLKYIMGKLVKIVLDKVKVRDLLIEGGSTTYTILNELKIFKLFPEKEIDTGVIRMKRDEKWGFQLTTKPGSYKWPEKIIVPNNTETIKNISQG